MKKLDLNQMEAVKGNGWFEDLTVGSLCGATLVIAATPAAPLALLTGVGCAVGAYRLCFG